MKDRLNKKREFMRNVNIAVIDFANNSINMIAWHTENESVSYEDIKQKLITKYDYKPEDIEFIFTYDRKIPIHIGGLSEKHERTIVYLIEGSVEIMNLDLTSAVMIERLLDETIVRYMVLNKDSYSSITREEIYD